MHLEAVEEPSDRWRLVGEEDATTPPTVARVLNRAGSRVEWRRAGMPVLFGDDGRPRPVQRNGRLYRFECVDARSAADLPHPVPLQPESYVLRPWPSALNE